ncbi:hypothetical protein [Sphingomonas sp.]|uniref:hypothetical protein n=1 Tax=Sphingomonas sp. TaxID=28214 RepID=UPI003AFF98BD
MHKSIMIVLSKPVSQEDEEAYNRWYSDVHLAEIVALPGVTGAARYKIAELALPSEPSKRTQKYIAIYELTANTEAELQAFVDNMNASIGAGNFDMSGPMDFNDVDAMLALPIGRRLPEQEL